MKNKMILSAFVALLLTGIVSGSADAAPWRGCRPHARFCGPRVGVRVWAPVPIAPPPVVVYGGGYGGGYHGGYYGHPHYYAHGGGYGGGHRGYEHGGGYGGHNHYGPRR